MIPTVSLYAGKPCIINYHNIYNIDYSDFHLPIGHRVSLPAAALLIHFVGHPLVVGDHLNYSGGVGGRPDDCGGGGGDDGAEAEEEVPAEPDRAGAVRRQPRRRPLAHRPAAHGGQAVRAAGLHGYRRRQLPSYLR